MPLIQSNAGLILPPVQLHYLDTATGADLLSSMGPDWTDVNGPGSGYTIQRINNEWGIRYGSVWHIHRNNVAIPLTTSYEVGIKVNVAGALYQLYTNPRVFAYYTGGGFQMYVSSTDWSGGAAAPGSNSVAGTLAAGDTFKVRRDGNVYTIFKNGASTGATWTDTAGAYASFTKTPGVGMNAGSTAYRFDNFSVDDI